MKYVALLVVTLVVISGVIAYLGDWIGRWMGKRRLSLFGMRPRHTAVVVTTVTGMLIAILTFVAIITISSNLREILLRGQELKKENVVFQSKNRELRDTNQLLTRSSKRLIKEVEERTEQVKAARAAANDALKKRREAERLVDSLQLEISRRMKEYAELKRKSSATEAELAVASRELRNRIADLSQAKADLALKTEELDAKTRDLEEKNRELIASTLDLEKTKTQIRESAAVIARQEDYIAKQQELLREGIDYTRNLLTGDVVLEQGDEVARMVIDSARPAIMVRAALEQLLDRAGDEAQRVGAGANDDSRAVLLVYDRGDRTELLVNEKLCLDRAEEEIVRQGKTSPVSGVIARLVVAWTTVKGQRAPVVLVLNWNKRVFESDDVIATRIIDGRQSEGRILLALMSFLREDVRAEAQRAGIVPVAGSDPEQAAVPISDEQLDHLMDLIRRIRQDGKRIKLQAVAKEDIFAAGPLTLGNIGFVTDSHGAVK